MKSRSTEDTLALLGGAILGAAAMYFLDPDLGDRRRQQVAGNAGSAAADANRAARSHFKRAASSASDYTDGLQSRARGASESAAAYAQRLASEAQAIAADLSDRASGYASKSASSASSAVDAGRRAGSHWLDRLSDTAHEGADYVQHVGHQLWDKARGLISTGTDAASQQARSIQQQLADHTEGWRKSASKGVSRASHTAQGWLGHDESDGIGAGAIVSSTVGCLLVGAGAMYFLDPKQGPKRRANMVDSVTSCLQQTSRSMQSMGRDLSNRLSGAARQTEAKARQYLGRSSVDSADLINRIRTEISGLSQQTNRVQFMADADGTVTVTGDIRPDELDGLLTQLHRVPGVLHVINRLTVVAGERPSTPTPTVAPSLSPTPMPR